MTKPTKNQEFTMPNGDIGILVSFTPQEIELIGFYCPPNTSFPSWIRSLVIEKIMGERIDGH